MYVCYNCDDQVRLFWNGDFLGEKGITYQTKCECLPDEAITRIYNGDNVLAVYGRNTGGPAFWISVCMLRIKLIVKQMWRY